MIIGDHEDVPGVYAASALVDDTSSQQTYDLLTDFKYSLASSYLDYPSIAVGRIPSKTNSECEMILTKIKGFEISPPSTPSFYNNAIIAAYFQDYYPPDGRENRHFIQVSENTVGYLSKFHNKTFERHYYADYANTSNSPQKFYDGTPLSTDLLSSSFNWFPSAKEISSSINKGRSLMIYRGHGDVYEWCLPNFKGSDLALLNNQESLPFVWSVACLTGDFSKNECFCEAFLKQPNGGCVGIVGASKPSNTFINDLFLTELTNVVWPYPGFSSYNSNPDITPLSKASLIMGDIVNLALFRSCYQFNLDPNKMTTAYEQRLMYNYFGAPETPFYTRLPTPLSPTIERFDTYTSVKVDNTAAYVAYLPSSSMLSRPNTESTPWVTYLNATQDGVEVPLPKSGSGWITVISPNHPVYSKYFSKIPGSIVIQSKIEAVSQTGSAMKISLQLSPEARETVITINDQMGNLITSRKVANLGTDSVTESVNIPVQSSVIIVSLIDDGEVCDSKTIYVK